jgi:ankyrin repeat protein
MTGPDPVIGVSHGLQRLSDAIRANDAAAVAAVLARDHVVGAALDRPMPGGAFGETPLLAAVRLRNREMVDVLVAAGADVNARSDWWAGGFGVLDGDHDLHAFLIERGATVNAYAAARLGALDRLEALVAADPSVVHTRGGDGQTPLHVAATVEVAAYLVAHGADIDAIDVDHESTAAQYLVRSHPAVARFLVSRGARTDLLMAAALGDLADVERHLDRNSTSIRTAVSFEYFPKINPRSGGTIYIWVFGWNQTAHAIARAAGHAEILARLLAATPAAMQLALACRFGDDVRIEGLIAANPGLVLALESADRAALVHAAQDNDADAVRRFLRAGWPVAALGSRGQTALHWAAFHGNVTMAAEILGYGPALEIKEHEYGGTPLAWAFHGSEHGWHRRTGEYGATVAALLDAGAVPPSGIDEVNATAAVKAVLHARAAGL